ncbi:MAG: hypothetical protein AAF446_00250 [Pseudomonadota bacterium]
MSSDVNTDKPGSSRYRFADWLERPSTIRRLWWVFGLILASTVAAQLFVHVHAYFGLAEVFGFNAAYGFLTCVAMVVFAKVLGWVLKRPVDYYEHGPDYSAESDDV